MTFHSRSQDENPPPAGTFQNQERMLLEIVNALHGHEVPTYFDQVAKTERDPMKPRQVMEPATRVKWVLDQLAEVKNKNERLAEHARTLERNAREHAKQMATLQDALTKRNEEITRLQDERDQALAKVAAAMDEREELEKTFGPFSGPSRRGRGRSSKDPR